VTQCGATAVRSRAIARMTVPAAKVSGTASKEMMNPGAWNSRSNRAAIWPRSASWLAAAEMSSARD
jgi:hypothetical protein